MEHNNLASIFAALNDHDEVREGYLRAPFGYVGGKGDSLDHILPELPYRKSYIEPFGGSGAVLLARQKSPLEVFNDRYAGVVALYRCVRDAKMLQELLARLELALHSREEFIWCKNTWEKCDDDIERAARWYYMQHMSFSSKGKAFGRATHVKAQHGDKLKNSLKCFWPIHHRLQNVQIENQDWRQCLADYDGPDAVFYLDPPYLDSCSGIYEDGMTKDEHHELLERIKALEGFVAISGYSNALYDSYVWTRTRSWDVRERMVSLAGTVSNNLLDRVKTMKRGSVKECLWIKESQHYG